jgi:hypothetical protein
LLKAAITSRWAPPVNWEALGLAITMAFSTMRR